MNSSHVERLHAAGLVEVGEQGFHLVACALLEEREPAFALRDGDRLEDVHHVVGRERAEPQPALLDRKRPDQLGLIRRQRQEQVVVGPRWERLECGQALVRREARPPVEHVGRDPGRFGVEQHHE